MRMILPMLLVFAACGGGDDEPPTPDSGNPTPDTQVVPRATITDPIVLQANDIVEATLTGGPADHAVIEIDAPVAKLDWNLHGHAGGGTQVVMEELGVMSIRYTFQPTAQADWFLLLRNKDAAAMTLTVKIELYDNMQWDGP